MKFVHTTFRSTRLAGIILLLFLALGLLRPAPVLARSTKPQGQQPILLDRVQIDIWPEYDQPSVLVIYHITLSAQVGLPATISIRIPAAVGKPHAVAWQTTDNALYDLNYDTKSAGEWTELQFSTPASDVQIEYYDPTLKKTGARRDYTFRWSELYTVQNLTLDIQQPVNATNMPFRPSVGAGRVRDGLTYYDLIEGKVNAGTTFDLAMSYDKPDDILTNPKTFQSVQPNQPIGTGTAGRVTFDQLLPWGVGGLGLLLIAAGSFWYWRTGRIPSAQVASGRPRHSRSRTVKTSPAMATGEETFCHQCGKRAAPGDSYCRACGTKLR